MKAPERIDTARLTLRKPRLADAEAVFTCYSNDEEVTRYLGWPQHRSVADTLAYLRFSDQEWKRAPGGPYLIETRAEQRLIGSTGFTFDDDTTASTGYVLAREAWGYGYATEALRAVVSIAENIGLRQFYALCHPEHSASWHVLEKCEFVREDLLPKHTVFPNLSSDEALDVVRYVSASLTSRS